MDIGGYLFGSGFGLLIVLLGWGDQLTTKNQETKDLQEQFRKKARLHKEDLQGMIADGGATEQSFSAMVDFLFSKEEKHLELFEKLKGIKKDLVALDKRYNRRYWLLTSLSLTLFTTGIISLLISADYKFWLLAPSLLLIALVFVNLIGVYNLEKKYTKNLNKAMESL
jgi:hypothetical protein